MHYRQVGRSSVIVSVIGFGGWVLGTDWYGRLTGSQGKALVRRALDHGITFFDTSNSYGENGISETLLAEALAGVPRSDYVLGTKFGYDIESRRQHEHGERAQRWDSRFIRRSLEDSLRRLGTEHVDVYELHNPRMDAIDSAECFGTLEELHNEGLLRAWGVALGPAIGWEDEGVAAMRRRRVDCVQTVYNVLEQDPGRRFLEEAEATGASVLARVPHASGALEGTVTKDTAFPPGDHRNFRNRQMLEDLLDKAATLRFLHADGVRTVAQLALQFIIAQPRIAAVLPTVTELEQLDELAAAVDVPALTPEELARIAELYAENFGVARREYAKR